MRPLTPVRAIRAKCIKCAGGRRAVRECARGPESPDPCSLHQFRMGKNPARKGIGRVMSSEDARSTRKPTTQVVSFERKKSEQGVGAGPGVASTTGQRRAKSGGEVAPRPPAA